MAQEQQRIVEQAKQELEKRYNRTMAVASSNLCVHCGLCVDQCHYYMATQDPSISPVAKAEQVRRVVKSEHDWLRRIFPWWTGAKELTEEDLDHWVEVGLPQLLPVPALRRQLPAGRGHAAGAGDGARRADRHRQGAGDPGAAGRRGHRPRGEPGVLQGVLPRADQGPGEGAAGEGGRSRGPHPHRRRGRRVPLRAALRRAHHHAGGGDLLPRRRVVDDEHVRRGQLRHLPRATRSGPSASPSAS